MTRFLFTVNKHPNEAFAIPVAREAAKLLRRQGHEVFVKKIPFKETFLGQVLQSKGNINFTETERRMAEIAEKFKKEVNPDMTFDFHCTESSKYWIAQKSNFVIYDVPGSLTGKYLLIELKAKYREFPGRLKQRIGPITSQLNYGDCLTRTSSHSETVKAVLPLKKFAKAISTAIVKIAKNRLPNRKMRKSHPRQFWERILKRRQRKRRA